MPPLTPAEAAIVEEFAVTLREARAREVAEFRLELARMHLDFLRELRDELRLMNAEIRGKTPDLSALGGFSKKPG